MEKITITTSKPVSEWMVRSSMGRHLVDTMRWHYDKALLHQSIFLYGNQTHQEDICTYVKTLYDTLITEDGNILTYREDEYNLDQINPGKVLFLLYHKYSEHKYRIAIEKLRQQLRNHPRTQSGGYWHKQIYPWQMWLDGLYMQGPFYAQYTREFGGDDHRADIDDIIHQFTLIESKARDNTTGLLYHAWDESRQQKWANKDTGNSPHFWGRAMGWYCMALVDTIDFIAESYPEQTGKLAAVCRRLISPVLKYQDAQSGLWYQVLDMGGREKNYLESTASAMFVYFFLKMLRKGLVPDSHIATVKAAADKAYQGLIDHKIRQDAGGELHLIDCCQVAGLGGNPYRDGSFDYYVGESVGPNDTKGVGPFILASMEVEGLCRQT